MRFRLERKSHALRGLSAKKFADPLTRAVNTTKDAKFAIDASSLTSHSPTEDESFRIQAELRRNTGLLYQSMIPPR